MAENSGVASSLFTNDYRDRKLSNKHVNYHAPPGVGSVSLPGIVCTGAIPHIEHCVILHLSRQYISWIVLS